MKDLRLLQIVPALESGGVEQGTIDVANYLADKEIKNTIISNGGKLITYLSRKYVKHFSLPVHSKNPFVIYRNISRIKKIILDNNINIVHVRSRAPSWSVYYACRNICCSVSTFHNVYGHQNIFKRIYNKGLQKVDNIVAISQYVKDTISRIYNIKKEKISVIHRGVDTDLYNPNNINEEEYNNFFSKYQLPVDKKIILYPGRLTEWKGQVDFLDTLYSLDTDNTICLFVGDSKNKKYTKKLERQMDKKNLNSVCRVLGHINSNEMKLMYQISDVIISAPLKPEGFCRTISEGMSMKKIVLCYDFGGGGEQIKGLDSLYAVTPFNRKEMVEKIKHTFNLSNSNKKTMGDIARLHVINNFSKETMLQNYFQFYNKNI